MKGQDQNFLYQPTTFYFTIFVTKDTSLLTFLVQLKNENIFWLQVILN